MSVLEPSVQRAVIDLAKRAPSAHNAQPARWRFKDGEVLLLEDHGRRLAVADPTGKDHAIGLGTAFEGLRLALSQRGLALGDPHPVGPEARAAHDPPWLVPVARASLQSGARADPLADWVERRRTCRQPFRPAAPATLDALRSAVGEAPDVTVVEDRGHVHAIARLNDRCAWGFLARPDYQAELYGWTRFDTGDARWTRDGLTADCLGLSKAERKAAAWLFRPRTFRLLTAVGLARPLVAEAARTRTAAAILLFHRPRGEDWLAVGRRFYRLWLEITRAGLALCPMSAVADSDEGVAVIRRRLGLPEASTLVNVFRVGEPVGPVSASPRLPSDEILV